MSTDSPSTTNRLAEIALIKSEVWLLGKCSLCGVTTLDHEERQRGKRWHFHERPATDLTDQQALNALVEIAQERCQRPGHECDWECHLMCRSIVTVTEAVQRAAEADSLRARLDTAEGGVLGEIAAEQTAQFAKFGEQNHPDGTGDYAEIIDADVCRQACQDAAADGRLDWLHVLREEVAEAFAETDPAALRTELIQVAAVAATWVEAIDRRGSGVSR